MFASFLTGELEHCKGLPFVSNSLYNLHIVWLCFLNLTSFSRRTDALNRSKAEAGLELLPPSATLLSALGTSCPAGPSLARWISQSLVATVRECSRV